MRLLLVEDDELLADGVTEALRHSFAVDHFQTISDASESMRQVAYDIVLLDLGLRDGDGLDFLRELRTRADQTPVLILTARDTLEDRVTGLNRGADDYLTKPFDLPELEARIRALLRRRYFLANSDFILGNMRFDTSGRRVYVNDEAIDLSAREVCVLELLVLNLGRVVSKDQILEKLCGWEDEVGLNAIEVYIHRLRKKITPVGFEFRTIRGLGYLLEKTA